MDKPIEKVLVVADMKRENINKVVKDIVPWLEKRVQVELDTNGRKNLSKVKADLVIVFGGDGSILSAARRLGPREILVVGVNLGHLGFMTAIGKTNIRSSLKKVFNGEYKIGPRIIIDACLKKASGEKIHQYAVNDVVFARGNRSRMVSLSAWLNSKYLTTYVGDGLIVATPTGSTAHSLSAGGPILHTHLDAFILNPLASHLLTTRSIVMPANRKLELKLDERSGDCEVSFDGQVFFNFEHGDTIRFKKAKHQLQLIQLGDSYFFKTVRDKLGWGEFPNENWKNRRRNRGCRY